LAGLGNPPIPNDISLISILDDLPAQTDALDFELYVTTLADIIASPATRKRMGTNEGSQADGKRISEEKRMIRLRLMVAYLD
jgi:hypothetical protein